MIDIKFIYTLSALLIALVSVSMNKNITEPFIPDERQNRTISPVSYTKPRLLAPLQRRRQPPSIQRQRPQARVIERYTAPPVDFAELPLNDTVPYDTMSNSYTNCSTKNNYPSNKEGVNLPVSDMRDPSPMPNVYDRHVFATTHAIGNKGKLGCAIRGDLVIKPFKNLVWGNVSATPSHDLRKGALYHMGGYDDSHEKLRAKLIQGEKKRNPLPRQFF